MDLSSFQCVEMAVFDSSTFSGGATYDIMNDSSSYQYFTGDGFPDDIKILKIYNGSTVGVTVSFRQIVDSGSVVNERNDYWPVGATIIIDLQSNHADFSSYGSGTLNGRKGQLIWGNAAAGSGNIYISGFR